MKKRGDYVHFASFVLSSIFLFALRMSIKIKFTFIHTFHKNKLILTIEWIGH